MIFSKLPRKEKIGFLGIIIAVFLIFLARLVIFPVIKKIQRINTEIKVNIKQLEHSLWNLGQKEEIIKEYQKYSSPLNKDSSDEEEMAKILSEIEELARKAGISLIEVKPQQSRKINVYQEYIINIEAEGEMKSLVGFLYYLNISSQLLRAEKLKIIPKGNDPAVVKASIEITKIIIS